MKKQIFFYPHIYPMLTPTNILRPPKTKLDHIFFTAHKANFKVFLWTSSYCARRYCTYCTLLHCTVLYFTVLLYERRLLTNKLLQTNHSFTIEQHLDDSDVRSPCTSHSTCSEISYSEVLYLNVIQCRAMQCNLLQCVTVWSASRYSS